MKTNIALVVNLALTSAFVLNNNISDIVEMGEDKSIAEINKGTLKDDILELDTQRSAINFSVLYWPSPVPYFLSGSLEMNARGVILRSFDQFRLKSCIDFVPVTSELFYIIFQKSTGCWSFIGRRHLLGQAISIGQNCDEISTVEHEILHALGYFHEQSRYDRDEYITIKYENLKEGYENNFPKVGKENSITNGVEYDYWSVMHYGAYDFSNGKGPVMVPKDSKYLDIIGQRLNMSPEDILELNLLYKCNSTIAFKMHCNFSDATMCEMTCCSQTNSNWTLVKSAAGGPSSDHTSLPINNQATGELPGYFMHVSTALGQEGDSARMETKRMRPDRKCHIQCLQFYYFLSGNSSDVLNIWLREFHDEKDWTGQRHLMGQITGPPTSYWQIHHVSLNASTVFQVEFEVRKGTGSSSGGISIDDVNLSEIECPHVTMQIDEFRKVLNTSPYGTARYSPRQYSTTGYSYRMGVRFFESYAGAFVQMMSGENDDYLEWPVHNKMVTLMNVDQEPNVQRHMSKERSFTTDRTRPFGDILLWDPPRKHGFTSIDENNQTVYVGPRVGINKFAYFPDVTRRSFLKGNSLVFSFGFYDIAPLLYEDELPCPVAKSAKITHPPTDQDPGPCIARIQTTTSPHPSTEPSKGPLATGDSSVVGNSPGKVPFSIHILILLSALLLLIP